MDLLTLKADKAETGAVLQLKHPASEEPIEGVTITLLGQDSKKYRAIQRRRSQATLDRVAKGKKARNWDAEEIERNALDDLVEMTVSWTGVNLGGEELPCNVANARRVYTELPWVREQAQEFVADRGNFLGNSPTP